MVEIVNPIVRILMGMKRENYADVQLSIVIGWSQTEPKRFREIETALFANEKNEMKKRKEFRKSKYLPSKLYSELQTK